jgi:hypothetical protein
MMVVMNYWTGRWAMGRQRLAPTAHCLYGNNYRTVVKGSTPWSRLVFTLIGLFV